MQSKREKWGGLIIVDIGISDAIANQSVIQAEIDIPEVSVVCFGVCVRVHTCMFMYIRARTAKNVWLFQLNFVVSTETDVTSVDSLSLFNNCRS